jgi:NADPH:quinone reductase-like Zn-dependent oxidoreductase
MRAVVTTGHGGFDKLQVRDDVPVPEPQPGEVLIRVGAAGVNNTDINTRTGWYGTGWTGAPQAFPRIQGADACGRIVAVGVGVDPARVSERVLVEPLFRGPAGPIYFGSEVDGAFAEFARMPAIQAHPVETSLTDAELASFPCSYAAAENMLARSAVRAGETVLVTGASGGVGSAAVQLARRRGATVIALASAANAAEILALGADLVLPREADPVAELGREAVDVVIDVVGGAGFPPLLNILRRGGRYAAAGAIAGHTVTLDLRTLYLKDLSLFGCTIFEASVFTDLIGYIERGELRPLVAATFPLAQIVAAQEAFLRKGFVGKIVLVP